jgi:predicted thioesterase
MKEAVRSSRARVSVVVEDTMTAILDGKRIHPVFSTFWLGYYAEVAARRAIEEYFDEGENAVGGELVIRHLGMAAVGEAVEVEATVESVQMPKIVCSIEARVGAVVVARGSQTQIVLSQGKIDGLVSEVYRRRDGA